MQEPTTDFELSDAGAVARVRDIAVGLRAMYGRVVNVTQIWEMPDATYERLLAIVDEAIDDALSTIESEYPEVTDTAFRESLQAYIEAD